MCDWAGIMFNTKEWPGQLGMVQDNYQTSKGCAAFFTTVYFLYSTIKARKGYKEFTEKANFVTNHCVVRL